MAKQQENPKGQRKDEILAVSKLAFNKSAMEFFAYGLSASATSCFVFGLDTAKTGKQMCPRSTYPEVISKAVAEHGFYKGVYGGIFASMFRQAFSSGGAGLVYDALDEKMKGKGVLGKALVPIGAGIGETLLTLPFELPELFGKTNYTSVNGAFATGVEGFYQMFRLGCHIAPGVTARNVGYWSGAAVAEEVVERMGWNIHPAIVGLGTGGVAGFATLPIDNSVTKALVTGKSATRCIVETARENGVASLYRGAFARFGLSGAYTCAFLLAKDWLKERDPSEIERTPLVGPVFGQLSSWYAQAKYSAFGRQQEMCVIAEEDRSSPDSTLTDAQIRENTCFRAREEGAKGKQ